MENLYKIYCVVIFNFSEEDRKVNIMVSAKIIFTKRSDTVFFFLANSHISISSIFLVIF